MNVREPFFDNAKLFVVWLVIVDHFSMGPLPIWMSPPKYFGALILPLCIPVIALISGYMCRNREPYQLAADSISRYLFPYILMQMLWSVINYWTDSPQLGLFSCAPAMWYLIALVWWRLLLAASLSMGRRWRLRIARPAALFVFLLAIVAVERLASDSFISSGYLGIVPFITYAPYFFLGYYLEKKHFERLKQPAIRTAAAVIVSAWVLVGVLSPDWLETFKIGRATWTDQLGYAGERLMLTACLVAVLPRRELTFKVGFGRNRSVREFNITRLGRYTIYPYVFHCIFIRFLDYYHESVDWVFTTLLNVCPAISGAASGATENFSVYVLKAYGDWWRAAWTIVVSLLLLFLLTSSVCRRLGKYIVEPTWLIRRDKEGVQDV